MEKETGKQIDEFPDYYVSNLGRVKSTKFGKEKIIKPYKELNGYLRVQLHYNGKVKSCRVHRLVAKAFLDNPTILPCVNHRDENPYNNVVSNLEGCTVKYNNLYGTAIQRMKATQIKRGILKPVKQLTLEGKLIAVHPSITEGARFSGLTTAAIRRYINGIIKNPRKYKWEFVS